MLEPVSESPSPQSKQYLRDAHVRRRAARDEVERERLALGFRDQLLRLPEVDVAHKVAAFISQDGEPGTAPLIDALRARGIEVLIPFLRADFDLEWGRFEPGRQEPGRFGILVPTTERHGPEMISTVQVAVCPGVAADPAGHRLGRGGGSYDRALARCGPSVLRVQLVYDDEVVDVVPTDAHDQRIDVIVTATRVVRVDGSIE